MRRAVVTGAGGFIGGHLVAALLAEGKSVLAVDRKPTPGWYQVHDRADNIGWMDLNGDSACFSLAGLKDAEVYHLAADMGGMGFIEQQKAACMLNVLNTTNMLRAALRAGAATFLYASTACVYRADQQESSSAHGLREDEDVYPAQPEDGYGWEKLFGERMCRHFSEDFSLPTRVARYHSVYGPHGTWDGGREKVIAALCRKVARAKAFGEREIEVWGDGEQTRSFLHIRDCIAGTLAVARGDWPGPLNVGSAELVSINQLAHLIAEIAGHPVTLRHVDGPLGVRGRCSDNTEVLRRTGWQPSVPLYDGLEETYRWIEQQVRVAA